MAIGGSITLITQARPRKTPCQMKPVTHQGRPQAVNSAAAWPSTQKKASASILEGTLAPTMVSQKTAASSSSMIGRPKMGEVTMRSMRWSRSYLRSPLG